MQRACLTTMLKPESAKSSTMTSMFISTLEELHNLQAYLDVTEDVMQSLQTHKDQWACEIHVVAKIVLKKMQRASTGYSLVPKGAIGTQPLFQAKIPVFPTTY